MEKDANFQVIKTHERDKKWVLVCPNFGERTARVELELTDFNC